MPRKRHSPDEVTLKLHQSDKMAEEGMLQSEIAKILGVSIMTYHRWRKARRISAPETSEVNGQDLSKQQLDGQNELLGRISALHSENSRLRRLVTDLLLEADRLEEKLTLRPALTDIDLARSRKRPIEPARRTAKRRIEAALAGSKSR
jgi:putative transposase